MSDIGARTTSTTTTTTTGTPSTTDAARTAASETAGVVKEQGHEVASTAREQGQAVTQEVRQEASRVVGEAGQHVRQLFDDTRQDLRQQAEQGATRVGGQLSEFSQGLRALSEGRPQEAGRAGDLVQQVAGQLGGYADRLQGGDLEGLLQDVRSFARRRPVSFLAGALAAGFLAGRVATGAKEASSSGGMSGGMGTTGQSAMPMTDIGVAPTMSAPITGDLSMPVAGAPLAGSGVNAQMVDDPATGGGGGQMFGIGEPDRGPADARTGGIA